MSAPGDFDNVLAVARPAFAPDDVLRAATEAFGLQAAAAQDLGSERDQTFLLTADDGVSLGVIKLSNAAEDPAILDMEALAVVHASGVDPTLPLAIPRLVSGRDATDGPAARRAAVERADGTHHIRLYDVLPGRHRISPTELSDAAVGAWGETSARLGVALRGFFHPRAQRTMLWDVQHAERTSVLVGAIRDARRRGLVERVFARFEAVVKPAWPSLRAQVVHGDLTVDNALTNVDGRITGIVDFGDMSHSALIIDLASVLDSLAVDRDADEALRVARLVVDGYQRITPLEPVELRLLGELWATRAAVTITISSWRAAEGLEDPTFAERYNDSVERAIEAILAAGWDDVARGFGAAVSPDRGAGLIARRGAVLGPAIEPLTYEVPIQMAGAHGVWMTDVEGNRFLDAYNNVPCIGHAHPRVSEAIARQSRDLNTNLRYLHPGAIELAERLVATCPPGLDTVMFVNSGSEANDLAWRLATTFTGHSGGLSTTGAYHGISDAIAPLSPETWPPGRRADHIESWPAPDGYRGVHEDAADFAAAIDRLTGRGVRLAATLVDGILTSDGFPTASPELVRAWLERTHAAGGLWIADEVQGGHGRTGEAMWSFQRYGIVPDVVTLGKPMGNGFPIGAVITRRAIAQQFADETVFFSTFGGNQVAVAAALAVLDVLDDERVLQRVALTGEALRDAIWEVAAGHPQVGEVRGVGLAIGIEIVRDKVSRDPDPATAQRIQEGLRARGVLVGTAGPGGTVIKVRPPLAFTTVEVPLFADALGATLDAIDSR